MMLINPRDPENIQMKKLISLWVKELAGTEVEVQAEEKPCQDASCPVASTILELTWPDGAKRQLSLHKPLCYIRQWDIKTLLTKSFPS
jgi:hypothetical protein